MKAIVPCLWFNNEAEEAANYYCAIFKTAQLGTVTRYGNEGEEIHGGKPGTERVSASHLGVMARALGK